MYKLLSLFAILAVACAAPAANPEPGAAILSSYPAQVAYAAPIAYSGLPAANAQLTYGAPLYYNGAYAPYAPYGAPLAYPKYF